MNRVRKLFTTQFFSVEHEPGECLFCAAARQLGKFGGPGDVLFLENELGMVARVECISKGELLAVECRPVTKREAVAELPS